MKIGVLQEKLPGENRVILVPGDIKKLIKGGHEVFVESGAGERALFYNKDYTDAGAKVFSDRKKLFSECEVILKIGSPRLKDEAPLYQKGTFSFSLLSPFNHMEVIQYFINSAVTAFALELIPRIARAQSMDVLSSMATLAGYKAVLQAADMLPKIFPLMMTAAGTVPPSSVLVLGAGVAGLSAIATAKRLGAKVEAFDPRPAVMEQVKSLGAQFIEMEMTEEVETAGGYAKMQSDAFLKAEQETIASRLPKTDVVITTAQIFGKPSPILLTEEMVHMMHPGSVIIDIAAEQGGNCFLTRARETVTSNGVRVVGAVNLPSLIPVHASSMLSKNMTTLINHIFSGEEIDFDDEIIAGTCVARQGETSHPLVKEILHKGGKHG